MSYIVIMGRGGNKSALSTVKASQRSRAKGSEVKIELTAEDAYLFTEQENHLEGELDEHHQVDYEQALQELLERIDDSGIIHGQLMEDATEEAELVNIRILEPEFAGIVQDEITLPVAKILA